MLYDAIFLSSDEVLKGQQGRKAMVLFSDGVDRDSKTSLQHAIEAAQRADTLVYCVYVAAEHEEQQGGNGGGQRRAGGGYPGGGRGGYPRRKRAIPWRRWTISGRRGAGAGHRALRVRTRPTVRRFCSRLQKKPADDILSFQKS